MNKEKTKRVKITKLYTFTEALTFMPFKSKETFAKYIKKYQGVDWSVGKMSILKSEGVTGKRYLISGLWIKEFKQKYKTGKLKIYKRFSPEEVRYTLLDIVEFSRKNKIKTVKEFIEAKQHEQKKQVPIIIND
jgi:hypothetical protein